MNPNQYGYYNPQAGQYYQQQPPQIMYGYPQNAITGPVYAPQPLELTRRQKIGQFMLRVKQGYVNFLQNPQESSTLKKLPHILLGAAPVDLATDFVPAIGMADDLTIGTIAFFGSIATIRAVRRNMPPKFY